MLAIALSALAVLAGTASAQTYPARSVTLVVPFSAGGPTDTLARIMAEGMRKTLGQPVVAANVTGASGSIAMARVALAAPDGYTIAIGSWSTHVVDPAVNPLPYDVIADFQPVGMIASNPQLIVARNTLPAKGGRELIAWVKTDPSRVTVGTTGIGTAAHISGVYFQNMIGTQLQFIPYRGAALVIQDMMAGRIDLMFDQASHAVTFVRTGKIKAYAVTAKTRFAALADVLTVDEAGLPGLYVAVWHAMWAPKGTPEPVIKQLNAAISQTLVDPVVRQRLAEIGQEIPTSEQQRPQGLLAYHKAEIEKWWPMIRAAGIKKE
ncbi:MAG: tripartite tricarboxylate transporter substrate binding protein BugD [Burkholderiales bacterium]|nr:tripartite tricarboxylate transporter substrate binding protein BugD [Burkholderiales bacterium]